MDIRRETRKMGYLPSAMKYLMWVRCWLVAILLGASVLQVQAVAPGEVVLADSVRPVEQAAPGPVNPHKPLVTRRVLRVEEGAAPMRFEVALKMRNFDELTERVARGERISPEEMAARHEPLAADYNTVAAWLTSQGLTITRRDPHHMAIFARAAVSKIQEALHVNFARVAFEGREYTSAISAPSVPAAIAAHLLGINGLQPHIRAHKHLIKRADIPNDLGGASYFPAQIAQAYQAAGLYNSNIKGSGEAIAIVIDTFPYRTDLEAFWKDAGVNQSIGDIQFIQAVPGTLSAPSGEETLDTEWSSSMAPSARVRVYAAMDLEDGDLDQAYEQVYEDATAYPDLGIHQMSMSYGLGETYTTYSEVKTDDQYFAELAGAGITVFASSGDAGSTPGPDGTGDESGPVQVETPASDPNVTGVGGTTLVLDNNNSVTSESVWNSNSGASGGGISIYFRKPVWQIGTGVVSGTNREVPDVACSADPNYGAVIVLQGVEQTVGGTSWASPTWAGLCALLNQARVGAGQSSIGVLGRLIYPLLETPNYPAGYLADIRDITSGNNATYGSNGEYNAATGYDLCTGLGTPLAQPLAELLASSPTLVGVQMPAAVVSVTPGQNATLTVTVTGTTATYQWQGMPIGGSTWSNLSDGGAYSGVTGATLTITGATAAMSGDQYQCIVTIGSTTVTTSPPSVLVVDTPLTISTLAGEAGVIGRRNGQGTAATFNYPSGVAVDGSGNVYVADFDNNALREISPGGTVSTPYGSTTGVAGSNNGPGNTALFNTPNAIAVDGSSNLYVADTGNNIVREISAGTVSTLAGTSAQFNAPGGIAVDGSGNVYVADTGNDTIREISPGGVVSTLAGQMGVAGSANGAAATEALFNGPTGVAVDGSGNVYVADTGNDTIREIAAGTVTTIAGQAGSAGYLDGLGGKALFDQPLGLAVDSLGNLYIADSLIPQFGSTAAGNNVLRELSSTGVVSTIAGQAGKTGAKNGTGAAAQFYSLQAVALTGAGQVYLADTYNQMIRMGGVPATRIIALSGTLGFGDVTVGQTATGVLTITNTGNTLLSVTRISYPAGFSGNWSSGGIPAGESQNVTVTFSPKAAIPYGGYIVAYSDATGGSARIVTSGKGLPAPAAPTVVTLPANGITGSSANFNGAVNPHGSATVVYFQYGPTTSYGYVTGTMSAGGGIVGADFSQSAGGLAAQAVYHFRAVGTNSIGTVYGKDETFRTLAAPVIGSSPAIYLGAADVQVAESVNPDGVQTAVYFQYGTSTGYGSRTASQNAGIGRSAVNVTALLPGLTADTTYHFQMVTTSAAGTYYGPDETFTTLGFITELVAATGDAAPGVPGAKFSAFGNPAINNPGYVAFPAALEIGSGGVAASGDDGIWAENSSGGLDLIALSGSAAPGTGAVFSSLGNPVYNNNEAVGFAGTLELGNGANLADATGIWSTSGGSLALLARKGGQAPGYPMGATFGTFDAIALPDKGGVILLATLNTNSTAGVTAHNDQGIWVGNSTSDLQLIVKEGDTYNGKTLAGIEFLPALTYVSGQTRSFAQGTGDFVFKGTFSDKSTGILIVAGGSLKSVVESGDAAPGVNGGEFSAFGDPAINANDHVAFAGTLVTGAAGVTASNVTGIWADDSMGVLQLIARTGSAAPGTDGTFATLSDPVYNDNEAVAFRGVLKLGSGQAAEGTAAGIWSNSGGAMALVARQGSQAPGCPAGVTFGGFTSLALPDQGGVVFVATLNPNAAGVTQADTMGIWAVDTNGNLQLIVREGDILDGKTITGLSFLPKLSYAGGQSRNFAPATGDLLYEATFSDKTSSIFEVVFP